jgi:hypothetical protein
MKIEVTINEKIKPTPTPYLPKVGEFWTHTPPGQEPQDIFVRVGDAEGKAALSKVAINDYFFSVGLIGWRRGEHVQTTKESSCYPIGPDLKHATPAPEPPLPIEYPLLARSKTTGATFLFKSPNEGTCLMQGSHRRDTLGAYSTDLWGAEDLEHWTHLTKDSEVTLKVK